MPSQCLSRWRVLIGFLERSFFQSVEDTATSQQVLLGWALWEYGRCDDQDTGCQMIRSRWTKWCGVAVVVAIIARKRLLFFSFFFTSPREKECGGGCNKWRILRKLLPREKKRRKKTRDWEIGNPSVWRSNIYINIALTNRFSLMKDFFLLVSLFPPRLFLASRCIRHDRAVIDQQFLSLLVP